MAVQVQGPAARLLGDFGATLQVADWAIAAVTEVFIAMVEYGLAADADWRNYERVRAAVFRFRDAA